MRLEIKKLSSNAMIPQRATTGAACLDVFSNVDVTVPPGDRVVVGTGLAMSVPLGYRIALYARSGNALKHGICLANSVGVVDSDYRNEVGVILHNTGDKPFEVSHGDRIAQLAVELVLDYVVTEVDELEDPRSNRVGGFGSTGQ